MLYDIRRQINTIINNEKKVAEKLRKRNCCTRKSDLDKSSRDVKTLEKRIKELDRNIVHRLIDKITVGNKYACDGVKKQNIKVYYKFIGECV